jgi:hypothetical protein
MVGLADAAIHLRRARIAAGEPDAAIPARRATEVRQNLRFAAELLADECDSRRLLQALVDKQAEDEALWATNLDGTVSASEAYLQQELRRLHALIEGDA